MLTFVSPVSSLFAVRFSSRRRNFAINSPGIPPRDYTRRHRFRFTIGWPLTSEEFPAEDSGKIAGTVEWGLFYRSWGFNAHSGRAHMWNEAADDNGKVASSRARQATNVMRKQKMKKGRKKERAAFLLLYSIYGYVYPYFVFFFVRTRTYAFVTSRIHGGTVNRAIE